ncbi:hypothetical protein D3C87_1890680 [compost metagenome]
MQSFERSDNGIEQIRVQCAEAFIQEKELQRVLPAKLNLRRKRQRQGQRGQEGLPAGQSGYRTPHSAIPVIPNHKPSPGINLKRITLLAQETQPL